MKTETRRIERLRVMAIRAILDRTILSEQRQEDVEMLKILMDNDFMGMVE